MILTNFRTFEVLALRKYTEGETIFDWLMMDTDLFYA